MSQTENSAPLDENFMVRTAYPDVYQELWQKKKLFKNQIHLFTAALAIGVLYNAHSQKKPHQDIVRIGTLSEEHKENIDVINILSQVVYVGPDKRARGAAILSYADGGLEIIWKEYQAQGMLDIPRIVEEAKKKWPDRIPELSHVFKGPS